MTIIVVSRVIVTFFDLIMALRYWRNKNIDGVVFYCTLAIILAIAF
ncbi:hypothetical protein SAMN05443270_4600 [Lacrimispora sphenoides]|jgi:uncharacterized membrane protein YfcA|nr:hypothetical protein [Lacrimispora sphenoides]SEU28724.1 hypothetical protein SAMN05443270_4600 [Lacrimispora sphenoides]